MNPIGAHMSIAGGPARAFERIKAVGGECLQIFVKPNVQWQAGEWSLKAVEDFHLEKKKTGIDLVVAHASYLLNLASPDRNQRERSILTLALELVRSARLGIPYLVLHPGSHLGAGEKKGLIWIAKGIDQTLHKAGTPEVKVLLETTAGSGNQLGSRLEHLRDIMGFCRFPQNLGVCLDTCHVFAAGFDISSEKTYQDFFDSFARIIGLKHLCCVHANDSKNPLGSGVDRHEQIGQGFLGLKTFRRLLHDPRLDTLPFILETPKGEKDGMDWDALNIKKLKKLRRKIRSIYLSPSRKALQTSSARPNRR
jgi:deoxyribonuclease-4